MRLSILIILFAWLFAASASAQYLRHEYPPMPYRQGEGLPSAYADGGFTQKTSPNLQIWAECERNGTQETQICRSALFNLALDYYNSDQFRQADQHVHTYLGIPGCDEDAEAHLMRAYIKSKLGDRHGTLRYAENAIRYFPADAPMRLEAYLLAVEVQAQAGKHTEAMALLQEARLGAPTSLRVLLKEADLLQYQGRYPEAEQLYLSMEPKTAYILNNLGVVQQNLGKHAQAIGSFEKAYGMKPDAMTLANLVYCYLLTHDLAKAEQSLGKAGSDQLQSTLLNELKAELDYRKGNILAAREAASWAISQAPEASVGAYRIRALAHAKLGQKAEALADCQQFKARTEAQGIQAYAQMAPLVEAEVLIIGGHHAQAEPLLSQALPKLSGSQAALAYGMRAYCFQRLGEAERAQMDLRSGEQLAANSPIFHEYQGLVLWAQGDVAAAERALSAALAIDPSAVEARYRRACLYADNYQADKAMADAQALLKQAPQGHMARCAKGAALWAAQDYAEAETLLAELLRQEPNFVEARFYLGQTQASLQRYKEAHDNLKAVHIDMPGQWRYDMAYGFAAIKAKAPQAQALVAKLQGHYAGHAMPQVLIAQYHLSAEMDCGKAKAAAKEALAIERDNVEALQVQLYCAKMEASYNDGLAIAEQLIRITEQRYGPAYPFCGQIHADKAWMLAELGKTADAIHAYGVAIGCTKDRRHQAQHYWNRGRLQEDHLDRQEKDYRMAHQLDPSNPTYLMAMGDVLAVKGDTQGTRSAYDDMIKQGTEHPDLPIFQLRRGKFEYDCRNLQKAAADFLDVIKRAGSDAPKAEAYFYLGLIEEIEARYPQAIEQFSLAIKLGKGVEAYFHRGEVHYITKNYPAAVGDYEVVLEQSQEYSGRVVLKLGHSYREMLKYELALRYYEMHLKEDPAHCEARHGRAYVLAQLQRYDEAIADFGKALGCAASDLEKGAIHANRGAAYEAKGDRSSACADYSLAGDYNPDHIDLYHQKRCGE